MVERGDVRWRVGLWGLWVVALCVLVTATGAAASQRAAARGMQSRWVVTDLGAIKGSVSDGVMGPGVAVNDHRQVMVTTESTRGMRVYLWQKGILTRLGALGGPESEGVALNERGQVVGWSTTGKKSPTTGWYAHRAFLWQSGRMRDLGTFGGEEGEALAINDRGQVVGWSDTSNGAHRAFLWQSGRMRDLGTLGGMSSWATDINERGQVVGWSHTKSGALHPFLWQDGRMRDLGTLGRWPGLASWGPPRMAATAVDERGDVVGQAVWSEGGNDSRSRVWLWRAGKLRALPACGEQAWPVAMNDRGEVIGTSAPELPWEYDRPVVWRNGTMTVLVGSCRFDKPPTGSARAISSSGQIVGSNTTQTQGIDASRAVIWQAARRIDLPPLQSDADSSARAINDRDQIVGLNGEHLVLWTRH